MDPAPLHSCVVHFCSFQKERIMAHRFPMACCLCCADSEYETDDSSADEATEEESERTRGGGSTADTLEGGDSATTTATSPSSPAVQNAARASFFSAPPTVVRLDPWRMFNKDKKEDAGEEEEEAEGEAGAGDGNRNNVDEDAGGGLVQEEMVNRDEDGPDTDVSESLEMDSRGEEGRGSSAEGSLEDLVDEEAPERGDQRAMLVEGAESVQAEQEAEEEQMEEEESQKGNEEEESQEGNKEEGLQEGSEEEMNEEELEKTAVSLAMAQLLVDIDQTSVGGRSDSAAELDILLPSDNDEDSNDVFETGGTQLPETESERVGETGTEKVRSPSEDTTESVLRSIREMEDTSTITSGEDTLRQVLQDVAAMPDLSDSEQNVGDQFKHLDERFITDRKKKPVGKKEEERGGAGSDSDITISTPSESLSSSSSSLNDVIQYNQRFLASGDAEDDLKPDEDMMRDYMTTLSVALDESYSDGEKDGSFQDKSLSSPRDEMNRTLQAEEDGQGRLEGQGADDSMDTNASSVYLTPEVSMEEQRGSQEEYKDLLASLPADTEGASSGADSVKASSASQKLASESQKPATKGIKVSDAKPKKLKDATCGQAAKGTRKLPEVPKPKVSASQPQNSKKSVPATKKAPPSSASSKLPAARSTKTSSTHSKPPSSGSASDSLKQQAVSSTSESSRQRATSSATSSDSSRASVPRALPKPGAAKRVAPSASSDRSSGSPAPVRGSGVASVKRTGDRAPQSAGSASGAKGKGEKGKTVIPVDRGSLWSDSSTERQASDSEFKKKIPVDASILPLPHQPCTASDMEDIPFADESEVDEKFYTPSTSVKGRPGPAASAEGKNSVRKRLLPSPPSARAANPPVPSVQQIHDIRQAEQAKAKEISSDKKWPLAEGEEGKGAAFINPTFGSPPVALKRRPGIRLRDDPRDRRSSSYDTPSTPDMLSDSDDHHHQTSTPTSSASELDRTTPKDKKKKPRDKMPKSSTASAAKVKMRKSKEFANKRKSEEKVQGEESKKERNRRSLLAMLLPKSSDKTKDKSGSAPASDSDYALPERPKVHRAAAVEEKPKKSKSKHKRSKSQDNPDEGLSSDIKGLKITPVFDTEAGQGDVGRRHTAVNRPVPIAPKASGLSQPVLL